MRWRERQQPRVSRPNQSTTSAAQLRTGNRSRACWSSVRRRSRRAGQRVTDVKLHIETTINGEPAEFLCEPQETLLSALRNSAGLTGTKEGCSTGDCGACSVLLDGRLVPSCLVLAPEAQGRTVTTIEGLARGDRLHPLQQKFLEHAAL